jgi:hypothetical protein
VPVRPRMPQLDGVVSSANSWNRTHTMPTEALLPRGGAVGPRSHRDPFALLAMFSLLNVLIYLDRGAISSNGINADGVVKDFDVSVRSISPDDRTVDRTDERTVERTILLACNTNTRLSATASCPRPL